MWKQCITLSFNDILNQRKTMIFHTDERFHLLDDIPEEYCGFVRHLLLQYISEQIADHMIDTMGDLI